MIRDILTKDEIIELTGKSQLLAQRRELNQLSIPYRLRTNGTLVIARADLPLLRDPVNNKPEVHLNLDGI